ncbi:helix-turn-helix domain-containing protein [Nocardioides zeae]|uniref:Helix-turn-helix domain-containing protein n=1 Tax=Nocardioides imazamoxiresistens TaxID=3231893 RepID=A0ABU3PS00_9ACTN|nr:helix-turn-helix domain-containing protein [Nocardioides zeae]MDT9592007.1 helix-turn-helix domain-containing protein [Nocardioides zeae]
MSTHSVRSGLVPRARPLPPADRRSAVLDAALPVVLEHGRAATTRQIAEAAGIAEGTLFRVFATKDELFAAVLDDVLDPTDFAAELDAVDRALPLEERLLVATRATQARFRRIFHVMTALGIVGPPRRADPDEQRLEAGRRSTARLTALLEPDADAFRVPLAEVVRLLRLLTFSGSHPHIGEDALLTPEQIVDVILRGTLRPTAPATPATPVTPATPTTEA